MANRCKFITLICVLTALFYSPAAFAFDLSLKRIVFEAGKDSEVITINKDSEKAQTYTLDWQHYRMDETKGLQNIPKDQLVENIRWADDMIEVSPTRITVPPKSAREVRLTLKKSAALQESEYRTHLWVKTEASATAYKKNTGGTARLAMNPAISIPVFIHHGILSATSEITDASLTRKENDTRAKVQLTLKRTGNRSLYGDFEFFCTAEKDFFSIKTVGGISVYTDVEQRKLSFNIDIPDKFKNACTTMQVNYRSKPHDPLFQGKIMSSTFVKS